MTEEASILGLLYHNTRLRVPDGLRFCELAYISLISIRHSGRTLCSFDDSFSSSLFLQRYCHSIWIIRVRVKMMIGWIGTSISLDGGGLEHAVAETSYSERLEFNTPYAYILMFRSVSSTRSYEKRRRRRIRVRFNRAYVRKCCRRLRGNCVLR